MCCVNASMSSLTSNYLIKLIKLWLFQESFRNVILGKKCSSVSHVQILMFTIQRSWEISLWHLQYTVFEQTKRRLLRSSGRSKQPGEEAPVVLSAFRAFALGAFSKTCATVLTYPAIRYTSLQKKNKNKHSKLSLANLERTDLDVVMACLRDLSLLQQQSVFRREKFITKLILCRVKTVIQAAEQEEDQELLVQGSRTRKEAPTRLLPAAIAIWQHQGPSGFYQGLQAQILKTILGAALMLMIKEKASQVTWQFMVLLREWSLRSKLKVQQLKLGSIVRLIAVTGAAFNSQVSWKGLVEEWRFHLNAAVMACSHSGKRRLGLTALWSSCLNL